MSRVHDVLRWANRRAVAEEVTRRGYRVSGETLNRWVRDGKEFPAIVERIVFDLFTIGEPQTEAAPPDWAERLEAKVDAIHTRQDTIMSGQRAVASEAVAALTKALTPLERLEDVEWIADAIRRARPPTDEAPPEIDASEAPGTAAPEGRGSA